MRRVLILIFIGLLAIPLVSATSLDDAKNTASQAIQDLNGKVPLTETFTDQQLISWGFEPVRKGGYTITIKNATYNSTDGTLSLYVNAWNNGSSLHIHNPIHWYMPFIDNEPNGAKRYQNFITLVTSYLDTVPYGDPVNDDTLVIYPSISGYIQETTDNAQHIVLRNATGDSAAISSTTTVNAPAIVTDSGDFASMNRGILVYDSQVLEDMITIDSAKVSIYVTAKANTFGSTSYGLTGGHLASNSTVVAGDYDGFYQTRFATDITYENISTSARLNWSLNTAGLNTISVVSPTVIYIRDAWDIDNTNPAYTKSNSTSITWRPVGYATQSLRPFMEVIYTVATPPSADFTSNVTSGSSPLSVQFNDTTTNNPADWIWDYGDGNYNMSLSNWVKVSEFNLSTISPPVVNYIPVAPIGKNELIIAGYSSGFAGRYPTNTTIRSTDYGATWVVVNSSSGWQARERASLLTLNNGSILILGGLQADGTSANDTWISVNNGSTWYLVNSSVWSTGGRNPFSTVLPNNHIVSAGGGYNNETWRSSDSGVTWELMNSSSVWYSRLASCLVSTSNGTLLLFGGIDQSGNRYNDTWISYDEGATWYQRNSNPGWTARESLKGVVLSDDTILLFGGTTGSSGVNDTWKSTDYGGTWTQVCSSCGYPTSGVYSVGGTKFSNDKLVYIPGYSQSVWLTTQGQNPVHTFTGSPGTSWTVSLTAVNMSGVDTETKTNYISISGGGSAPVSSFTVSKNIVRFPGKITATDSSTNTPTAWNYSWGDGTWTNGTTQNPTHQYVKRGWWTVTLLSSNAFGSNTSTTTTKVRVYGYD